MMKKNHVFANAMLLNAPLLIAHDNDWWEHQEKLQIARKYGEIGTASPIQYMVKFKFF